MNVYNRTDFAKAARRLGCPNYPSERAHYPPGEPYVASPIPPAIEVHLAAATARWTEEVNTQRTRNGYAEVGQTAVTQVVAAPILATI